MTAAVSAHDRTRVQGRVEGLFIGPRPDEPVGRVVSIEVVAGRGVVGDRYYVHDGAHEPLEDITLFAREGVDAARAESGLDISLADLRRNVVTSGIDFQSVLGAALRIGDVLIESLTDNPPCAHLQRLAGKPLLRPLVGRGGVRGRVVRGGTIQEGDAIEVLQPAGAAQASADVGVPPADAADIGSASQ